MSAVTTMMISAAAWSAGGATPPAGPDVASYQHPRGAAIDWKTVSQHDSQFALVKATEGHTYTNPYFNQDYNGAHTAGLVRSAYHYARPATPVQQNATDQANYFIQTAGTAGNAGDLPPTLDLEETGGLSADQLVAWTRTFLTRVQQLVGRPPMIYTYPYFWTHAMANSTAFRSYPLWIADYRSPSGPKTPLPGGWSTWTFWQYTASGHLAGVPATVDLDRFNGDANTLRKLATPPTAPSAGSLPGLLPLPALPLPLPPPNEATALPSRR